MKWIFFIFWNGIITHTDTNKMNSEKVFCVDTKGRTSSKTLLEMDEIDKRGKELEIVVKLIRNLDFLKSRVLILLNPEDADEDPEFFNWFQNRNTKLEFFDWLLTHNHKVDGSEGNWSNGFLGSRWADKKFRGKWCRIAFYGKDELKGLSRDDEDNGKYKLMICKL